MRLKQLTLAVVLVLSGAAAQQPRAAPAPDRVTVYAAASLTEAFRELGDSFRIRHPGVDLRFNFAGSQQLALQLTQGAPADVFASADERWMGVVRDSGLVGDAPAVFAHNRLVVILPAANRAGISALSDLARPGLKLVLAADAVPAGRYSRQALERLGARPGFGAQYAGRVLANVVSLEENVKAVVAKVQLGEADGGIVYRSDLAGAVARKVTVLEIPVEASVTAGYPIAPLRGSRAPGLARAFVALVLSPAGQRVLEGAGFIPVSRP